MRDTWRTSALGLMVGLTISMASCGASTDAGPAVEAVSGAELFSLRALGSQPGCITCHSRADEHVLVGPSLAGVGDQAASRIQGLDAETYLRSSIVDPNRYVVDGFPSGKMPDVFGEILTDQQVAALVGFLMEETHMEET